MLVKEFACVVVIACSWGCSIKEVEFIKCSVDPLLFKDGIGVTTAVDAKNFKKNKLIKKFF